MSGVAVVTGASSGIGAAPARRLVKEGFEIVLGARRTGRWTDLASVLGGAAATPLDVTAGVAWAVTRPAHIDIDDVVPEPGDQAGTRLGHRRSHTGQQPTHRAAKQSTEGAP